MTYSSLKTDIQTWAENTGTDFNNQLDTFIDNTFSSLSRDPKVRFADLEYFSFAKVLESKDFIKIDTLNVVTVKWSSKLKASVLTKKEKELNDWLKSELKVKNVIIKHN